MGSVAGVVTGCSRWSAPAGPVCHPVRDAAPATDHGRHGDGDHDDDGNARAAVLPAEANRAIAPFMTNPCIPVPSLVTRPACRSRGACGSLRRPRRRPITSSERAKGDDTCEGTTARVLTQPARPNSSIRTVTPALAFTSRCHPAQVALLVEPRFGTIRSRDAANVGASADPAPPPSSRSTIPTPRRARRAAKATTRRTRSRPSPPPSSDRRGSCRWTSAGRRWSSPGWARRAPPRWTRSNAPERSGGSRSDRTARTPLRRAAADGPLSSPHRSPRRPAGRPSGEPPPHPLRYREVDRPRTRKFDEAGGAAREAELLTLQPGHVHTAVDTDLVTAKRSRPVIQTSGSPASRRQTSDSEVDASGADAAELGGLLVGRARDPAADRRVVHHPGQGVDIGHCPSVVEPPAGVPAVRLDGTGSTRGARPGSGRCLDTLTPAADDLVMVGWGKGRHGAPRLLHDRPPPGRGTGVVCEHRRALRPPGTRPPPRSCAGTWPK